VFLSLGSYVHSRCLGFIFKKLAVVAGGIYELVCQAVQQKAVFVYIHMHALTNDVLNIQCVVVWYSHFYYNICIVFQLVGFLSVLCSICQYIMMDYCQQLYCVSCIFSVKSTHSIDL